MGQLVFDLFRYLSENLSTTSNIDPRPELDQTPKLYLRNASCEL